MKKILAWMVVASVGLSTLGSVYAQTTPDFTITPEFKVSSDNKTATLTLPTNVWSDVLMGEVYIKYPTDVLKYKEVAKGKLVSGTADTIEVDSSSPNLKVTFVSEEDTSTSGDIGTITFDIVDDFKGDINIEVLTEDTAKSIMMKADGTEVSLGGKVAHKGTASAGSETVGGTTTTSTTNTTSTTTDTTGTGGGAVTAPVAPVVTSTTRDIVDGSTNGSVTITTTSADGAPVIGAVDNANGSIATIDENGVSVTTSDSEIAVDQISPLAGEATSTSTGTGSTTEETKTISTETSTGPAETGIMLALAGVLGLGGYLSRRKKA